MKTIMVFLLCAPCLALAQNSRTICNAAGQSLQCQTYQQTSVAAPQTQLQLPNIGAAFQDGQQQAANLSNLALQHQLLQVQIAQLKQQSADEESARQRDLQDLKRLVRALDLINVCEKSSIHESKLDEKEKASCISDLSQNDALFRQTAEDFASGRLNRAYAIILQNSH